MSWLGYGIQRTKSFKWSLAWWVGGEIQSTWGDMRTAELCPSGKLWLPVGHTLEMGGQKTQLTWRVPDVGIEKAWEDP